MSDLMPIGRFSMICRLTVKALRHYDELGLLRPAAVDPGSGYRYYRLGQAREAEMIGLLRSLDMPLSEIRVILGESEGPAGKEALDRHRGRIEERIAAGKRILATLDSLMARKEDLMDGDVSTREIAPVHIASVRITVSLPEMGPAHERAFMEIFSTLGRSGIAPAGPPMSIYHDPEFNEESIDIEIAVPISGPVEGEGRVTSRRLDGGPAAVTLHAGPYEEVHRAYRALQAWMQEHGHESSGPPREVYLAGPPLVSDPAEYRTEVIWPIR